MTFDTVGTDTPAAPATSAIVTRALPFSGRGTAEKASRGFDQLSRFLAVEHAVLAQALDRGGTPGLACRSETRRNMTRNFRPQGLLRVDGDAIVDGEGGRVVLC